MIYKKIISFVLITLLIFSLLPTSFAANLGAIGGVQAPDLKFTPDGGGKFIYVNNNEGIRRTHLTDSSNQTPEYIMTNKDMAPDRYSMYLSFINRTETRFETTNVIDEMGFDIEVDVELIAKTDATIFLDSIGFCVTDYETYYENGVLKRKDYPWSCLSAVSDFMKRDIYQINSSVKYTSEKFKPQKIEIKKGETVWLSEFIQNYSAIPWLKAVHMLADFKLEKGTVDINVAALKSTADIGDRHHHNPNAHPGLYYRDRQYKGIADTLPSVTSDVLSYKIDDYFIGGTSLPVTVYNQFQPEGNTLTKWFTHLNPQEDIWSRDLCAESDMLSFKYKDDSKLSYYGIFVPENEKNNVWEFDCFHSDTTNWEGEEITGYKKSEYIPNYPLTTDIENSGYGCNLGNYGVSTNYHIKIENAGSSARWFNYNLKSTSDNIVNVKDKSGKYINSYSVSKGITAAKTQDTMASVELPAGEVTEFFVEVILPTNCAGGMENSFTITDSPSEITFLEPETSPYLEKSNFTGDEYYKWNSGELYISKDNENFEKVELDVKTKALFEDEWNDYEIKKAGNGYTVRCSAYIDTPSLYSESLKYFNNIYILDENFNARSKYQFDRFPSDVSYAFSKYYVSTSAGNFYSNDGVNWKSFLDGFTVPVATSDGDLAASFSGGTLYITDDGVNFSPVKFIKNAPKYVDTIGKYFYYTDKNKLFLSTDCINWSQIDFASSLTSIDLINGEIIVNGKEKVEIPDFSNIITLKIENKIIVCDEEPKIINDKTLVPVRALLEELGADVSFDAENRKVNIKKDMVSVVLTLDSEIAMVNNVEKNIGTAATIIGDRTFVPVRFLAESFGFDVDWNSNKRQVVITSSSKNESPHYTSLPKDYLPEGGFIKTENAAVAIATALLLQNGEIAENLKAEQNTDKNWNIINQNGEIILILSKDDAQVLGYLKPSERIKIDTQSNEVN